MLWYHKNELTGLSCTLRTVVSVPLLLDPFSNNDFLQVRVRVI